MNPAVPVAPSKKPGFLDQWFIKCNDLNKNQSFFLQFELISSRNGFKRVAEILAIHSIQNETGEILRTAARHQYELRDYQAGPTGPKIGESFLSGNSSKGVVQSKGRTIRWDLQIQPKQDAQFELIPLSLQRWQIIPTRSFTEGEDLRISGMIEVDGKSFGLRDAPAMRGSVSGPSHYQSWTWAHCNTFVDDNGQSSDFVFEGLSVKHRWMRWLVSPQFSTFNFLYQGQQYAFNSLWRSLRAQSQHDYQTWHFQVESGDLRFVGSVHAKYRDFSGINMEDTDGSMIHRSKTELGNATVSIYRRGKLERTFTAKQSAAFEVTERHANPYVPLLI